MADDDRVSKDAHFSAIVSEAAGFYRSVLTVASSFLGGSLLFMRTIAPKPASWSLFVLAVGWLLLVASIGLVVCVRRLNLDSGHRALTGDFDCAKAIDDRTRQLSNWAMSTFVLGITAIMLFGMMNIGRRTVHQEDTTMTMSPRGQGDKTDEGRKSIPFGDTGPDRPTQPEQETTTPEPTPAEPPSQDQGGAPPADKE